jgi:hypothetical protein
MESNGSRLLLLVIPAAFNSEAGQAGIQLLSFDVIPAQAGIHFLTLISLFVRFWLEQRAGFRLPPE